MCPFCHLITLLRKEEMQARDSALDTCVIATTIGTLPSETENETRRQVWYMQLKHLYIFKISMLGILTRKT